VDEHELPDRLRADIRFLGRLLGETIAEQAGDDALRKIEAIRRTAMRFRRQQEVEARRDLEMMLAGLGNDDCLLSVHAATLFAQLSNIAEDQHVKRLTRADLLAGAGVPDGGIEAALGQLHRAGVTIAVASMGRRMGRCYRPPDRGAARGILDRQREIAAPRRTGSRPSPGGRRSRRCAARFSRCSARGCGSSDHGDEIDNGLDYHQGTFLASCRAW
jgi:phosphoenolpyruvate carboxylase